jgi:hypothetical protein
MGAGPGSANENVGLDAVGTPPLPEGFGLDGFFLAAGFFAGAGLEGFELGFFVVGFFVGAVLCWDGRWTLPAPRGCGGCGGCAGFLVVLVLDGVVEEVVPGVVEVVDGVVVLLVVGVELHDSVSLWTGPVTGSGIADSGVFGGTSTVKLTFWPPTRVTVTTHVSADATGTSASPSSVSMDAAVANATTSFRLLNKVALSPPANWRAHVRESRVQSAARQGRY